MKSAENLSGAEPLLWRGVPRQEKFSSLKSAFYQKCFKPLHGHPLGLWPWHINEPNIIYWNQCKKCWHALNEQQCNCNRICILLLLLLLLSFLFFFYFFRRPYLFSSLMLGGVWQCSLVVACHCWRDRERRRHLNLSVNVQSTWPENNTHQNRFEVTFFSCSLTPLVLYMIKILTVWQV